MAIHTERVTVTTDAALAVSADASTTTLKRTGLISNTSAGTVYVGGDDVTTSNGLAIGSGASFPFALEAGDDLYLIAGSSLVVQVLYNLA